MDERNLKNAALLILQTVINQ